MLVVFAVGVDKIYFLCQCLILYADCVMYVLGKDWRKNEIVVLSNRCVINRTCLAA